MYPGENLDQCRLSRAILTQQAVDLSSFDPETDLLQGNDAWKSLFDPPHFEQSDLLIRPTVDFIVAHSDGRYTDF